MIKQFMTDVERDTNRRNTIKIKQFDKGKRINDGEFARLSSLSKRSSNGSDRAMTNRQNLRLDDPIKMGQLFTGKYDATNNKSTKNLNM